MTEDFSLVLGGPLFQILRRAHLSGDALGQITFCANDFHSAIIDAPRITEGAGA